jgi:hypothetical protein
MAESLFTFSCPCCGKQIEVDTRSGKARAVRPQEAKGGQSLDDLLSAQKKDQKRLADLFASAKDQQAKQSEALDAKLQRAKEEAKKDKDERPRNPFDLD